MTDEEWSEYGAQYNDVDTAHSKMAFKTVQKASEFIMDSMVSKERKISKETRKWARSSQTLTDVEEE